MGFREATLVDVLKGEVLGFVGVYVVSVVLAALIAFLVAGRIVTPLNTLTKGIEAVGSGEIVSIPVTSSDELGQIASVFNSTMDRLKDYIQTDEERRRTQENVVRFLSVVSEAARGDLTKQAPVTPDTFGKIADAYNAMVQSGLRFLIWLASRSKRWISGRLLSRSTAYAIPSPPALTKP